MAAAGVGWVGPGLLTHVDLWAELWDQWLLLEDSVAVQWVPSHSLLVTKCNLTPGCFFVSASNTALSLAPVIDCFPFTGTSVSSLWGPPSQNHTLNPAWDQTVAFVVVVVTITERYIPCVTECVLYLISGP